MTHTSITLDDVAAQVTGKKALIPDTCALLDLLRLPYRSKSAEHVGRELEATHVILAASDIAILIPPLVEGEFNENKVGTTAEANGEASRWLMRGQLYAKARQASGMGLLANNLDHQGLADTLSVLTAQAQRFLDMGLHLEADQLCKDLAFERVVQKVPPSGNGQQMKDCVIAEHVLAVGRKLSASGSAVVFVSSNKSDFGKTGQLLAPLDVEFPNAGVSFAGSWAVARHQLGL